jgi:hypothetical protein
MLIMNNNSALATLGAGSLIAAKTTLATTAATTVAASGGVGIASIGGVTVAAIAPVVAIPAALGLAVIGVVWLFNQD